MSHEAGVRFASQTYSWQMSGRWFGRLDSIAHTVKAAGFAGIEPEVCMIDRFETSDRMSRLLDRTELELAAMTLVLDWRGAEETESEREEADRAIELVRAFPSAKLAVVQMPSGAWTDRTQAQHNLLSCLRAVTARALDAGVAITFHPNSPSQSIVRDRADYDRVLTNLPEGLGWTPDTGHLHLGGMDPVDTIRDFLTLVDHIHLKDADQAGSWVPNGQGVIDLVGCVDLLARSHYRGWVVLEDESPEADGDPDSAAAANGKFVRSHLEPLFTD
jgi:inosose dehydratase